MAIDRNRRSPRNMDRYYGDAEYPQTVGALATALESHIDLHYTHNQLVASASWVIVHNLGKRPSVVVIDSGGDECEGSIAYDSLDQITITFSAAFGGVAYLN